MNVFQKVFYSFSSYADPTERKIGIFFKKLNEEDSSHIISRRLLQLMQDNIVRINLLSEEKYKGYKYLTKTKRRKLYQNAELISADFMKYLESYKAEFDNILAEVRSKKPINSGYVAYKDQLFYLSAIMSYLSPENGKYAYRESSTFGELLKNPAREVMLGDCNQIVTLYIYLYSQKYQISDLRVKTYPGHVALHFYGIDIEATNGEFKSYQHDDQHIAPIQEIISINLLDTTDQYYKTHKIDPKSQLQSARLALLVSNEKQITIKNLEIAYNNTVSSLVKQNDFNSALKYAKQSKDFHLIQMVGHNGTIYFLDKKQYKNAEKFAQYSSQRTELMRTIIHSKAIDSFNNKDYYDAIAQFKRLGGHQYDIDKCYMRLFLVEQNKLGKLVTADDVKRSKPIINKMRYLAKMSGDKKLIEFVKTLTKFL